MIRNGIYTDGRILPFGNGTICLKRIRNRDDKHIRIYRKHAEDGSYLLCMVSGIENNEPAYRAAVTGWFREYARVHLKETADFYAKEMQVTFNRKLQFEREYQFQLETGADAGTDTGLCGCT